MYFVLYDRHMKSIGQTYILEKWSRVQRAADFDSLTITGEQIPFSANPFIVVVNDRQGRIMFSGLASTPVIDDKIKKTSIQLKDYMTLFNSEIIVDWSQFTGVNLSDYINFVMKNWMEQTNVGFPHIMWDSSPLLSIRLDPEIKFGSEKENTSVYSLISDAINYYSIHCETNLDVSKKRLTFKFKRSSLNRIKIKLSDFGINTIEKSFGEFNRATIYDSNFNRKQEWSLTNSNSVLKISLGGIPTDFRIEDAAKESYSVELYYVRLLKGEMNVGDRILFRDGGEAEVASFDSNTQQFILQMDPRAGFSFDIGDTVQTENLNGTLYIMEYSNMDLVYPAKNKNFIADASENSEEALYSAIYNAVMELARNKYQENIDLDAQKYRSVIDISSVDFSYSVQVYTDEGFYKTLPVGEIETDSTGKHIVRLGQRIQEITQEL